MSLVAHLPSLHDTIAAVVILVVLSIGWLAHEYRCAMRVDEDGWPIDDWAGKAIDRHVERALNEGERPTIDPDATPIADAALRHVIATRAELAAGARAEDFGGGR